MLRTIQNVVARIFIVRYRPEPAFRGFMERAQRQEGPEAEVIAAVLDAAESRRLFGVPLARRGIQPVFLRVVNRGQVPLRLHLLSIDPSYYTPLEAAGVNHFSLSKRFSAFGLIGWLYFFPLLLLLPFKLITARRANLRMNDVFERQAFHLRPIPPSSTSEGFVFTRLDAGTKIVRVLLHATGGALYLAPCLATADAEVRSSFAAVAAEATASQAVVEFVFTIQIPGIAADHLHRDFSTLHPPNSVVECNLATLVEKLHAMPPATTNRRGTGTGDPVNLVVIGEFETILRAFAARWDESETITLATCWRTARAFLLGAEYRYSPVSPLYLFGRSQDVALQRARGSINERLHLRLWYTPLRFAESPVWVGQVSRDIGVRFTPKTWNLTTHRIDPDVDESRDYVFQDLLEADAVYAAGYVEGVGPCDENSPRRNLTGDPYFTDGKRAAVLLAAPDTKGPPPCNTSISAQPA
jgi:LssY-like putative type I secretion system component LssY